MSSNKKKPGPILVVEGAALDAVRQWEFTPGLKDCVPTLMIMTVTVQFSLN